jgi:glycosyltransferase involved in cell wall biosynthesis
MIAPGAQPPVVWGSLNTDATQEHCLKICFISGALPDVSCGIGDYVDALARALARRDHEIVVLTTASPDLRPSSEYRVVPLQTTWSLGEAGRIAAAVRREQPDVLHLQFPGVGFGRGFGASFTPWALRLHRHKPLLAATLHEFHLFRLRRRAPLAVAMSACDLVISPDPIVLASVQRYLRWRPGLDTAMIPVAANFWPEENAAPGETPKGRELTIGYWGFLRPDKGVDLLLEAFAQIRQTRPAQLVLAGDPGPDAAYIASVRRHADELGVSASIRTTGKLSTEQLSAELMSFDACVLPFRDGLSQNRTTYAGAVAHGLYVVTTGLDGHAFAPETNTAFVPPNDRDALVAAILEAPDHPRKHVRAMAGEAWDEIADLHLAAYRRARGER